MERARERWPDLEARLVAPGDQEVVEGRVLAVPPATDPHGHVHTRVAYVVRAHARARWIVGTDRLMRLTGDSDFAPDVAVYQHRAGTQMLKAAPQLAFEVVGRRSMAASTRRARILAARGVETIVCIAALPISPSGIGVRENLFVQMLAVPAIGAHATPALSLSLLALAGSLFWSLIGGIVYMMFRHKHHLAERELATEA